MCLKFATAGGGLLVVVWIGVSFHLCPSQMERGLSQVMGPAIDWEEAGLGG